LLVLERFGVGLDLLDGRDLVEIFLDLVAILGDLEPVVEDLDPILERCLGLDVLRGVEAKMPGGPFDFAGPFAADCVGVQLLGAGDVRDEGAKLGGQRPGRRAKVILGGEGGAVGDRQDPGEDRRLAPRRREDLLGPLVEEMPADRGPEQDQEQGAEESRIVASRGGQGTSPIPEGPSPGDFPAVGGRNGRAPSRRQSG
jgi:hypothetical protein